MCINEKFTSHFQTTQIRFNSSDAADRPTEEHRRENIWKKIGEEKGDGNQARLRMLQLITNTTFPQ